MKSVAQILKSKAEQRVFSVAPEASVQEAAQLMAEMRVGALLVVANDKIVGIVSERDFARKLVAWDRPCSDTKVAEIMTPQVLYVDPSQTNEECMALMTESRLRHLPVLEQGRLIGLVSIGDLVKDLISEQQFIIEQLEHYIMGRPTEGKR